MRWRPLLIVMVLAYVIAVAANFILDRFWHVSWGWLVLVDAAVGLMLAVAYIRNFGKAGGSDERQ